MEGAYRGRTAVITGASRGIGAGLAGEFARAGIRLGLCARSIPANPDPKNCVTQAVDITDANGLDDFTAAVEKRFGKIDLWINNAAVLAPVGHLLDADPELLDQHFKTNVLGVALGSRAYVRHARSNGGGVLINVTSGAATRPLPGAAPYCAGKAAVNMLTETLQLEEREYGLHAFALSPGVVDTGMQTLIRSQSTAIYPWIAAHHDRKRDSDFTPIEDIAACILGLAFDPDSDPTGRGVLQTVPT